MHEAELSLTRLDDNWSLRGALRDILTPLSTSFAEILNMTNTVKSIAEKCPKTENHEKGKSRLTGSMDTERPGVFSNLTLYKVQSG